MPLLIIENRNQTLNVPKGYSILEACLENRVPIYHTCGGNASCSTCRVEVLSGENYLTKMDSIETEVLDAFDLKPPHRLGCQAQLLGGEVRIRIPDRDKAPRPNKTPKMEEGPRGTY